MSGVDANDERMMPEVDTGTDGTELRKSERFRNAYLMSITMVEALIENEGWDNLKENAERLRYGYNLMFGGEDLEA
jgi:hypothetical protein